MKTPHAVHRPARLLRQRGKRVALIAALAVVLLLVLAPTGLADVYWNIGPAPQTPAGGWLGRYPLSHYQLDQYFPGVSVSLFGGVDVSGVPPLIAFCLAQIVWTLTAFLATALITLFTFAFSLDLVNGGGPTGGSGALGPVSQAIHSIYANTLGTPWLVAAILVTGLWAMWKALVQRRYTETAGALGISVLYVVLALAIVAQPQRTIAPASRLSNEVSAAFLSLTNQGNISSEAQAQDGASEQLFKLLVLDPWSILEFGGTEHCVTQTGGTIRSVPVQPLSTNAAQDTQLTEELGRSTEVRAPGKTCIDDLNKYAPHFLAYPFQSPGRNAEYEALKNGEDAKLPESDPAKHNGTYPLGPADEPAAEAMGKGGQYERLLLSIVILAGELGAWLLVGALALAVILAQILLLLLLCFAPVALIIGVFPGRGHAFFTGWLARLAGFLARKAIYSLILAVVLAVCQALDDATSNLGWLMSFLLQAAFLWGVFLQRNRLVGELLAATAGLAAARESGASRLQTLYYATRLSGMAGLLRRHPQRSTGGGAHRPPAPPPTPAPDAPHPSPAATALPSAGDYEVVDAEVVPEGEPVRFDSPGEPPGLPAPSEAPPDSQAGGEL
jgi:hypothetical protein